MNKKFLNWSYFSVSISERSSPALFFQPFCGNERNWIFRNLEFREKILEFSEKIIEFREKILEFSRKILEFREKLLILGNKFGI